jgi:hypothetical protein
MCDYLPVLFAISSVITMCDYLPVPCMCSLGSRLKVFTNLTSMSKIPHKLLKTAGKFGQDYGLGF